MAGLFLVRDDDRASEALAAARAQFGRHGFAHGETLALPGWRLLHFPYIQGGPATLMRRGDDFAAVAGTLSFDGLLGAPALEALLDALDPQAPDWSRLAGQFALVLGRAGRSFVLTDHFAAFQLFHDTGRRVFSTSFLAAAEALPRVRFDAQGVYEFAFNVVPIGDDTVLAELKTLGPREVVELSRTGSRTHALDKPLASPLLPPPPVDAMLAGAAETLRAIVAPYARHFGERIFCPLSGGLDSRLLLAALRDAGVRPRVYVYGAAGDEDVRIAQAIGAGEGFAVEHVCKAALRTIDPDGFAEQVARNFHDFDALPTYGNIFDNGGNALARDARHAGGALAASGGCGEIFRNFFFLPDRPVRAREVAASFYARFARRDATEAFDAPRFLARIEAKILGGIGRAVEDGPLPRPLVDAIYPWVRCRALFGREISLEARHSPYLMPFLDQRLVAAAAALPQHQRNAGRFEATLLNAIDPALARYPSAYGHDFAGAPGLRHRLDEWSTRVRPLWLRRASYALQRRMRPMGDEHGGLLAPEFMRTAIDLEMPAMRRFFHVDRIDDSGLWRRLACLQYLAEHLGGRLGDD